MRRKVWDGMKVLVFVCVVLPRLTGVERGEEAECVGLRWTLVWTSWTGMCRPKERERAQRKGEGRATHAVPTNGPRRRCQGVSGRATPLTSSSGRMPSSSSMPYASAARGRKWGRALSPAERKGSVFQTICHFEYRCQTVLSGIHGARRWKVTPRKSGIVS